MLSKKTRRLALNAYVTWLAMAGTLLLSTNLAAQESRIWVDSSGKHKIEAIFESIKGENVLLKLPNGQFKQIPLSLLSSADQDHVKILTQPKNAGAPPPKPTQISPVSPSQPTASQPTPENSAPNSLTIDQPKGPVSPQSSKLAAPVTIPRIDEKRQPNQRTTATSNTLIAQPRSRKTSPLPPGPTLQIGARIGDLDIDKIEPPEMVNGIRSNPKYLIPVERSDLELLPNEFQNVALLLLEEARRPREAIRALDFLKVHWPKDRQPTLIKLVINCASSDFKYNREAALEILADRDSDQSFPYIFARVDDTSFTIRSTAYQLIRRLGDRRAIEPLARRFDTDDVDRIASLLRSFGSESETAMQPFLTHPDPDIRLRACNLIGKIGTPKSLPALQEMAAREETMILQAQTRSSINKIKRRSSQGQ
jgi:hypothetical protein